jgi:7-keto-8-aminopelargonate synthetase-like enzyme
MTEPSPLQQTDRTYVRLRNRKLSYFSGCDYFRMASDPQILAAVEKGLKQYGLNVAASRLTTGNHALYGELERALSHFFDAESALLTGAGYITNLIVCQALAGKFSHALIDERAHPSLSDASRFLDCPILRFRHRDVSDFQRAVKRCGPEARLLLLTDGLFSHDGSAAPLKDYHRILPRDAMMLVDDAHGAGVLGKTGKGTLEHAGLSRKRVIQTITLSKAFGTYGGAILSSRAFRRVILDRSGLFIGHTPLPLPLANAALRSVQILQSDRSRLARLRKNSQFVKDAVAGTGHQNIATPGPIVAVTPRSKTETKNLNAALQDAGIFPPLIHYPTAPTAGYFRFVISSEHTPKQLKTLVSVLA